MSVPADQLQQGQPQVFTEQDFAAAENPPPGAPVPGAFSDSAFGPDPNEPAALPQQSFLDRAGSAIKSGYHDIVGDKTDKAGTPKSEAKPGKITAKDIALNAAEDYYKYMPGLNTAYRAARLGAEVGANPKPFLRALVPQAELTFDKVMRNLASADNAFGSEPVWVDANGKPVGAVTTADVERNAKATLEHQQKVVSALAKLHPAATQAAGAIPEGGLNLLLALGGGAELKSVEEASARYPEVVQAFKNPVVRAFAKRAYELLKEAPRGMKTMFLPSAYEATNTYHEIKDNGGSVGQAVEGSFAIGASSDLLGSLPVGMRGPWVRRMLMGVFYGPLSGVVQTEATNPFLPKELQQKNTAVGLGINSAFNGVMATVFGIRDPSPERVNEIFDNVENTAQNDPDPEARASAQRILNHANQMALASGGRSEPAMLGASHGEQARKQVVDAPHEQLYGQHPAYTAAYDAAKGQIQDEAQRQQYAKGIAAADTALNASWQHFFKLRKVIDDGVKDYQAAGQMPDLLAHAAKVLRPETFNDLQDFLSPPGKVDPNSPQPGWMQQGMSPQYARDIVLRTLESGQLPPEFKQSMDALAQRRAAFMKANPNIDPDTGEPITPVEGTPKPQEPSKPAPQGKPPDESPKPPPTAGAAQPKPALHPLQTLAAWLDATKYPRAQNVMRYAVALPQNLQQPMVDWAVNQSPMEAESAFADAANKGVLPEGVTNETEGSTQPAETAAKQDQARVRATEAKAQPEAEKGGHAEGRVAAGNEGSPVRQNEHAGNGNAAPAEGHAEAPVAVKQAQADLTDAQNDLNEKLQNGVVGSELDKAHDAVETARVNLHVAQGASVRSAPVQSALEDAGVAPEEATVAPNGDVRISPDASPEAAQKAVDVAAADTGATNTEYPEPTPEQAKAGNYRKGGITFPSNDGNIRVKIENPDGSVRSGDWGSRPLKGVHYGYFPDTVSADGQPLDVLLTHNAHDPTRPIAFIRQHDTTTGKFDELKAVMGTRSRNEALQAYWKQYPRDLHLKLTPNGSQDVVMMNRAKAVAFLKSGHVDVPPHPVSGRPMLKLQQTVPVEFDIRAGNISGVRDILDKLGRKHDLSGLTEEAGIYTGKIPRSAVPDLRRALEKNRVELETKQAPARQPRVAGRVRENARASGAGAHPEPRAVGGRSAQKVPAKRSPPPEGLGFVRSSAPVFEEGVSGHIGAHPVSVVGVHYSPKEGLTELDPAEAGTGSAGAERRRYGMGNFGRSGDPMARVMSFYVKDSAAIPAKESAVSGSNRYEAVLNNLYDVKADPDGIIAHAHAEGYGANTDRILEDIRSHGYDGFVSAEPQAGQHARVATVVGVDGKIPVKPVQTLAERYQEPGVHRVAERVARVRDKFEEAAKQTKDELKKRTKRPMFLLRQENADEKNLAHLYFEYAPSPDFKVKDAVFNRLTLATRKAIHDEMAKYIGPDRLPEYVFGKHNPVVTGYGGYLGRINPSARVDYDSGISNKDLLQHAQDIADAYNQQSVLVVSDKLPKKAPALDILFDGANDPAKLEKFWTALRDKTDGEAVGFSQIDGGITILNLDAKPEDAGAWFAKLKSAVSEISDQDGVKYEGHETQVGFDFVGGNYDRYLASLQGRNLSPREKAVDSLQIESYDTLASGISWGQRFDERAAKGLVAAGNAGVHARSERYRAVARLTRDKPSLADVRAAKDSVAQTEKRYAGDLKAFDEGGVALPSPKGGPSKLSRSQWVAVRTPEFLRWGGDWLHDPKNADVLLDKATGEPQVFYHETAAVNEAPIMLQGFRTDLPTSRHNDYRVPTGVFLKAKAGDIGVGYTGVRRQLPMFLRMRKPLVVDDKDQLLERLGGEAGKAEAEVDARIKEVTKLVNEYAAIAKENPDNPLMARAVKQFVERTEESFEGDSLRAQEVIRKEMQAQGYDGVILKKDQGRHETIQTYIALDSKDIKSADFNVGTFSERAAPMFKMEAFPKSPGERMSDVRAAAEKLVGQFKSKPNVVVHPSRAEATPEAKTALDNLLGDSNVSPAAMYLDGTLHVFADANRTTAELESAVMHEMVHFGLRKVFGEDMNPLLDDIWKNVQNDRSFADTLDAYRDAYKDRPNLEFQRNIAEEYVAHLAETQSKPGVWRKVVDWFRAWGRQHGLVHDWTDDDIRNLIRSVYSDLREGRTSIAGLPAARTTVDFAEGLQRTTYRGAAHGDFIHDMNGDWSFQNPDVHAELYRSLVDGEPSLNADPVGDSKITVQGVKDLAALAGEEHANLTLPDSVPAATVKGAGVPFATYDGMHVLRPEHTSSPMFALRNRGTADPDVQAVIDQKIGYDREPTSPWEWIQAPLRAFHFRQMANDAKAYAIDAGAYIDLLERKLNKGNLFDAVTSAYKQYWLTRNIRQIAMAVLRRGVPMATTKGYEFRPGTEGLLDIWKPMLQTVDGKNNMELYGAYKIGVRAKRLLHEFNPDGTPKEKLLTEDEADKFIALGEKHPEFKEAFAKEQKFINELLDFAVERGALDPKTAEVWKRNAYVPFRRIIDGVEKPSDFEVRGVNDKIKSKAIRGAEYALKDPNQALVNNVIRMLDHVYNNDAKRRVMALGELSGAVKKLPLKFAPTSMSVKDAMNAMRKAGIEVDRADLTPEDLSKIMTVFKPVAPFGRNIESTVEKGRLVWWEVNDPRLLRSIHDMRAINSAMTDKVIKYVGAPARWVRLGVTMSPKFMAKIMFKDMVNTFGQTGTNPNMLKHIWTNTRRILSDDKFIDQLRLNGFNGNEYYKVDEIAQAMERLHGNGSFTVLNGVKKAYRAYRRVGWVSEQLSRTRVAEHTLDRGGSLAEAAWQGQNTLNWQKHGYGTAAKLLMRTVPFLNAHLQGMTRIYDGMLGRDVIEHRGRAIMSFFIKSMALAIPSMVLEAENQNNKDYQRLPDYMKDAYWNIYIAGHHYVLPKPFEWGAMAATMPQRALRVATGQDSSREFWKAVGDTLTNDVVMLPIPAAFQEPIEQWGNKDLRTGLPIESEALQNREPAQRYNPSTTLAARVIGGDIGVAPVRVQHAVNGYFSSVGMFMLQMMSGVMRATGNYPAAPERRGGSWIKEALEQPFGGAPAATEPGNQYLSDFYQAQAIADQVSGSAHAVATSGDYGRAQQLVEGNPLAFRGHHELQVISVQLSQLRKQERIVEASPFLSPQQKRAQLNDINEAQKQLLDRYEPLFRAILDGKKEIETEQ